MCLKALYQKCEIVEASRNAGYTHVISMMKGWNLIAEDEGRISSLEEFKVNGFRMPEEAFKHILACSRWLCVNLFVRVPRLHHYILSTGHGDGDDVLRT